MMYPTIEELYTKLSGILPELISDETLRYGDRKIFFVEPLDINLYNLVYDKHAPAMFDLICNEIERRDWYWSLVYGTCKTYTFRIFKENNIGSRDDPYSSLEVSDNKLGAALASFLHSVTT